MKLRLTKNINFVLPAGTILEVQDVTEVVIPTPTGQSYPFNPASWVYKKAGSLLHPDSPAIIADIVKQSKDTATGGSSIYFPNIEVAGSPPIFHVTTDIPKKTLIYSSNMAKSVLFRVPDGIYAGANTDKHCVIIDWIDKSYVDMWVFDPATLKASHGGLIQKFMSSDATIPAPMGARAAGIAAQAGMITLESLASGVHKGVVAIATSRTNRTPKFPANRVDGYAKDNTPVQMGQMFRLPASFVPDPSWPPILKILSVATRDYGMVIVDTTIDACINFAYIEDPRPRGESVSGVKLKYFGGLPEWKMGQMFPWSSLNATV